MAHTISSNNQHEPNQHARLDAVPEDIQYIIASELEECSPSTVLFLAQTSHTLRQAALPVVYRDIVLTRGPRGSQSEKSYRAFIEMLQNDFMCHIARHFRGITVTDEIPEKDLITILDRIAERGTLQRLSWETPAHIPESVLNKLQTTWPELDLSVRVLNRRDASCAEYRQMDVRILSSPLLRTLTYFVYYAANDPVRTEWPKLAHAIAAGGNLKILRIRNRRDGDTTQSGRVLRSSAWEELMPLDLAQQSKLPALEEFTHSEERFWSDSYPWDKAHCKMLSTVLDWSKLRKLDFGSKLPVSFFKHFTGTMPNLKELRFGVRNDPVEPVRDFINSVEALESLHIDQAQKDIQVLWPAIEKHRNSLKELILRPSPSVYTQPEPEFCYLESIAKKFPLIESLGHNVPCGTKADPKYLNLFSTMKLRNLDIFLHLSSEASDYSARLEQNAMGTIPEPPINKENTRRAAIEIMETVSQGQSVPLDCLTLHISRVGCMDRFQTYMMWCEVRLKRKEDTNVVGDKMYEFRGDFEWGRPQETNEELLFKE